MNSLKEARLRKGLTQMELGAKLGLLGKYAQKRISQLENGVEFPSAEQKALLCKTLEVSENDLGFKTRITKDFSACLVSSGLSDADIRFILDNRISHPLIVKKIREAITELSDLSKKLSADI